MGLPEPIEPAEPDPSRAEREPPPSPAEGDRDWLVGPEEGLGAELERGFRAAAETPKLVRFEGGADDPRPTRPDLPAPVLHRPGGADAPGEGAAAGPRAGAPAPPPKQPTLTWERGADSVPALRRDAEKPRAAAPDDARDFPMDDAEERAHAAEHAAQASAAQAEAESEAGIPAGPRPHEIVAPSEFEVGAPPTPWWSRAVEAARTDRRVQAAIAVALAAWLAFTLWPRGDHGTSIGHIRAHAAEFDGRLVRVSGRVVDVFDVGGGWAYDLRQGRDTLVVFSRTREPRRDEHLVVSGTISTGYLDGQPRLALFETPDGN